MMLDSDGLRSGGGGAGAGGRFDNPSRSRIRSTTSVPCPGWSGACLRSATRCRSRRSLRRAGRCSRAFCRRSCRSRSLSAAAARQRSRACCRLLAAHSAWTSRRARHRGSGRGVRRRRGRRGAARCRAGDWASNGTRGWRRRRHRGPQRGRGRRPAGCTGRPGRQQRSPRTSRGPCARGSCSPARICVAGAGRRAGPCARPPRRRTARR